MTRFKLTLDNGRREYIATLPVLGAASITYHASRPVANRWELRIDGEEASSHPRLKDAETAAAVLLSRVTEEAYAEPDIIDADILEDDGTSDVTTARLPEVHAGDLLLPRGERDTYAPAYVISIEPSAQWERDDALTAAHAAEALAAEADRLAAVDLRTEDEKWVDARNLEIMEATGVASLSAPRLGLRDIEAVRAARAAEAARETREAATIFYRAAGTYDGWTAGRVLLENFENVAQLDGSQDRWVEETEDSLRRLASNLGGTLDNQSRTIDSYESRTREGDHIRAALRTARSRADRTRLRIDAVRSAVALLAHVRRTLADLYTAAETEVPSPVSLARFIVRAVEVHERRPAPAAAPVEEDALAEAIAEHLEGPLLGRAIRTGARIDYTGEDGLRYLVIVAPVS